MSVTYKEWIGREEVRTERILLERVAAMAATLDLEAAPETGEPLPPGWQWLFFNSVVRRSELGEDGHPRRGGFLPPVELPRRMWAGSRISYLADIPIGETATRISRILRIENKTGRGGALCFVTVQHTTFSQGEAGIIEEQDIVYREASPPGAAITPQQDPEKMEWGRDILPDTTLLFRYSALTFNGHRIHYDREYARENEGYPDLVVHGPLTATLLQQLATQHGRGRPLARFEFRGVSPLFVGRPFRIEGRPGHEGELILWARGPQGEMAMSASAAFR